MNLEWTSYWSTEDPITDAPYCDVQVLMHEARQLRRGRLRTHDLKIEQQPTELRRSGPPEEEDDPRYPDLTGEFDILAFRDRRRRRFLIIWSNPPTEKLEGDSGWHYL